MAEGSLWKRSVPSGEPACPALRGPGEMGSFILPSSRVASFGAGPWEWWGHPGPCGQALCSTSLALRRDTSGSPTGTSPSFSPPQGLGFWLARGPMWGQLCGPRQRGPAVCLLKEEKQHSDY